MANTVTKKLATKNRLRYLAVGDGTTAQVIPNATLLADMEAGPLKDLFNATYADQAAMRAAILDANVRITIRPRKVVAAITTKISTWSADIDTDAVTATKPEVNLQLPEQAAEEAYVEIEYVPTPAY